MSTTFGIRAGWALIEQDSQISAIFLFWNMIDELTRILLLSVIGTYYISICGNYVSNWNANLGSNISVLLI